MQNISNKEDGERTEKNQLIEVFNDQINNLNSQVIGLTQRMHDSFGEITD